MKKIIPLSILTTVFLISCDIRTKDKPPKHKDGEQKIEHKYNTTVQIIDTTYNFGKIKEGDVVEYNFRFKNTGTKPLHIDQASASCGCTVPEKPEHPIAPGEIGFIKVKFNSDRKPGEAHKSVTVISNARPEFPTLYIKGTVIGKEKE